MSMHSQIKASQSDGVQINLTATFNIDLSDNKQSTLDHKFIDNKMPEGAKMKDFRATAICCWFIQSLRIIIENELSGKAEDSEREFNKFKNMFKKYHKCLYSKDFDVLTKFIQVLTNTDTDTLSKKDLIKLKDGLKTYQEHIDERRLESIKLFNNTINKLSIS